MPGSNHWQMEMAHQRSGFSISRNLPRRWVSNLREKMIELIRTYILRITLEICPNKDFLWWFSWTKMRVCYGCIAFSLLVGNKSSMSIQARWDVILSINRHAWNMTRSYMSAICFMLVVKWEDMKYETIKCMSVFP